MENFTLFEGQNEIEFLERFSTEAACFEYLAHHKWASGFVCPNCKSTQEHNCKTAYHKRCKNCLKFISPTTNTLFHKVKFGIVKAFYVVFKMSATTKSISAEQLAKAIGVNRKTALLFQQKVRLAMKSSGDYPMLGQIEVDEAFIGQKEENNIGRGAEDNETEVSLEKSGVFGVKRMYVQMIENASSKRANENI